MQSNHDDAPTIAASSQFPLFVPASPRGVLTFNLLPPLTMGLTFLPRPPPSRPGKRSRAAADIDGEHSCLQKKKRRLRLILITSRLSPQFSHPATNIVDRGSSKIAVWAKQKALGRNLLRKAAILNRIRRQSAASRGIGSTYTRSPLTQEKEQQQLHMARLEFDHGAVDTYTRPVHSTTHSIPPTAAIRTGDHFVVSGSPSSSPSSSRSPSPTSSSPHPKSVGEESTSTPAYHSPNAAYAYSPPRAQIPRRDYSPLPPSPLGLSNYDAFDLDEGISGRYHRFDDGDDEQIVIPYNDDDEDDEVPFSPSAVTSASITTVGTTTNEAVQTPPPLYSDIELLDPSESVFGAYDQVKEGADATWPSPIALPQTQLPGLSPGSTSPNFPTAVATAPTYSSCPKRTDSFTMSPNLRPLLPIPTTFASPNLTPAVLAPSALTSPNLKPSATSTSRAVIASPNFTASAISPNLTAHPPPFIEAAKRGA